MKINHTTTRLGATGQLLSQVYVHDDGRKLRAWACAVDTDWKAARAAADAKVLPRLLLLQPLSPAQQLEKILAGGVGGVWIEMHPRKFDDRGRRRWRRAKFDALDSIARNYEI